MEGTNNSANNAANNNNDLLHEILHEIENNHPETFAILGTRDLEDVINTIRAETDDPIEIRRRVEIFIHHFEDDDFGEDDSSIGFLKPPPKIQNKGNV
jgi:hypothetical protein